MKTIALNDEELHELVVYFEAQLSDAKQRMETLQQTLARLNLENTKARHVVVQVAETSEHSVLLDNAKLKHTLKSTSENHTHEQVAEKPEQPSEVPVADEVDDSGEDDFVLDGIDISRLDWGNFILRTLNNNDKFLTTAELVDLGISGYGLGVSLTSDVSRKLTHMLNHLVKQQSISKQRVRGVQYFYYGLPAWNQADGTLKPQYLQQLQGLSSNRRVIVKDDKILQKLFARYKKVILMLFKSAKKLLTIQDFSEAIIVKYKLTTEDDTNRCVSSVSTLLEEMISKQEVIIEKSDDAGVNYYALSSWYKKDGGLKKYYIK